MKRISLSSTSYKPSVLLSLPISSSSYLYAKNENDIAAENGFLS